MIHTNSNESSGLAAVLPVEPLLVTVSDQALPPS